MTEVGVVYLYRFAEGSAPVERFIASYRKHRAGLPHDLYVVFKGFPDGALIEEARKLFGDLPVWPIVLPDTGYDIGSYAAAARQVTNERLLFLNTFSRILADDWLTHMDEALCRPGVGLVGATGSWLSQLSSLFPEGPSRFAPGSRVNFIASWLHYPGFPNPHVRTNAFMLRRELFLSLKLQRLDIKDGPYRFESGKRSLTNQILKRGAGTLVVDRFGQVFAAKDWERSRTFWKGDQENLLIADNQTEDYQEGGPARRKFLETCAWADPRMVDRPEFRRKSFTRAGDIDGELRALDGLKSLGHGEWRLEAPLGELEHQSSRKISKFLLLECDVAAQTPSPIWARAKVREFGDSAASAAYFPLGPIGPERRIRSIVRVPRTGGLLSLVFAGSPGSRFSVRNFALRELDFFAQVELLESAVPGARRGLFAERGRAVLAAARLQLRRARTIEQETRVMRRQLADRFNSRYLDNYAAWRAATEPVISFEDRGQDIVSVIAVVREASVDLDWWRSLIEALGSAVGILLLPEAGSLPAGEAPSNLTFRRYRNEPSLGEAIAASVKASSGTYTVILDDGYSLHRDFLAFVTSFLRASGGFDWIYTDEDEIDAMGTRSNPVFKPDWSPTLARVRPYTGAVAVYARVILERLDSAALARLVLEPRARVSILGGVDNGSVGHLPSILVHRHRVRRVGLTKINSDVSAVSAAPSGKISIVIPTAAKTATIRGKPVDLIRNVIASVRTQTSWRDYEIIVVPPPQFPGETRGYLDANSARIVETSRLEKTNLSVKMNRGAAAATGDLIVFLNDDIEVIANDWLERMAEHASRPEVGVVGALLLFEDGRIQHAGAIVRDFKVRHLYAGAKLEGEGYLGWLAAPHELLAVTGACFMVRRDVFAAVGGFDERLMFNYNEIDLCLRLRKRNLSVIIEPRARLYHFERRSLDISKSMFHHEHRIFFDRWSAMLDHDPFYPRVFLTEVPEETLQRLGSEGAYGPEA